MRKLTELKIQTLQSIKWLLNPPAAIVPVWNAYNECQSGQELMFVTWWGGDIPVPAGYTRFSWNYDKGLPLTDDGREYFDVVVHDEGRSRPGWRLHRDDVVLVYPGEDL